MLYCILHNWSLTHERSPLIHLSINLPIYLPIHPYISTYSSTHLAIYTLPHQPINLPIHQPTHASNAHLHTSPVPTPHIHLVALQPESYNRFGQNTCCTEPTDRSPMHRLSRHLPSATTGPSRVLAYILHQSSISSVHRYVSSDNHVIIFGSDTRFGLVTDQRVLHRNATQGSEWKPLSAVIPTIQGISLRGCSITLDAYDYRCSRPHMCSWDEPRSCKRKGQQSAPLTVLWLEATSLPRRRAKVRQICHCVYSWYHPRRFSNQILPAFRSTGTMS
jgi:hypothetical protein